MNNESVRKLMALAQKDSKFLHTLVFDPEKAINELSFLDRKEKGSILSINPEDLIGILVDGGELFSCGDTNTCGFTCTHTSSGIEDLNTLVSKR